MGILLRQSEAMDLYISSPWLNCSQTQECITGSVCILVNSVNVNHSFDVNCHSRNRMDGPGEDEPWGDGLWKDELWGGLWRDESSLRSSRPKSVAPFRCLTGLGSRSPSVEMTRFPSTIISPSNPTCLVDWFVFVLFMTVSGRDPPFDEGSGSVVINNVGVSLQWWCSSVPLVFCSVATSMSASVFPPGLTILRVNVNHSGVTREDVGRDQDEVNVAVRRPMVKKGIERPSE